MKITFGSAWRAFPSRFRAVPGSSGLLRAVSACSEPFRAVPGRPELFRAVSACSGLLRAPPGRPELFRAVPGCSEPFRPPPGCSELFRAVPVGWGAQDPQTAPAQRWIGELGTPYRVGSSGIAPHPHGDVPRKRSEKSPTRARGFLHRQRVAVSPCELTILPKSEAVPLPRHLPKSEAASLRPHLRPTCAVASSPSGSLPRHS